MNIDRIREVLGVWAPMAVGLFIIVTSINFYLTATLTSGPLVGDLEPWRFTCSAGAFFVGGVLILSTYGRYSKTKEARREALVTPPSGPSSVPAPHKDSGGEREDHHEEPKSG
jgi:hypothetical protein